MKELEQVILDTIESIYCAKYTGKLKVDPLYRHLPGEDPEIYGYKLTLGLNKDERPLIIAGDGTWEQFLEYVKKELHERNLVRTEYFTAIQLYPYEEKR